MKKLHHLIPPSQQRLALQHLRQGSPPVNHTVTSDTQHLWSVSARAGFNLSPERS